MRLKLLSRAGCHLCDQLAAELTRLRLIFDTIDVDMDADLRQRYGEAVPVLVDGEDDREVGRAPFSAFSLKAALAKAGMSDEAKR